MKKDLSALISKRGFSLIELLVSISIIGVIIGISLFAIQSSRAASRDTTRKTSLETIRSGLELYKSDCGYYPPQTAFPAVVVGGMQLTGASCTPANTNVYIQSVPSETTTGRNYYYSASGASPTIYTLCAALENKTTADTNCTAVSANCGAGVTCSYSVNNP